jgi:DNA-binding PadR family transcriptional regulator
MGPGTLYTTIQRLLDLKLIVETKDSIEDEGRRRYYKLTRAGKSLFEAELSRMDAVLRLAQRKKLSPQGAQ